VLKEAFGIRLNSRTRLWGRGFTDSDPPDLLVDAAVTLSLFQAFPWSDSVLFQQSMIADRPRHWPLCGAE
jgi:hypothetical protein